MTTLLEQINLFGDDDYHRKTERRDHCGGWFNRHFDPETGRLVRKPYYCDLWRDKFCPECFNKRVDYLRGRAQRAVLDVWEDGERHLRLVKIENKREANKLARKLSKDDYLRLPTTDGDVFLMDDENNDAPEVDYKMVTDLDWERLASTPEKRNVSGNLGKSEPLNEDEKVKVKSIIIHSDTTAEQERQALAQAAEETADLEPKTLEEAEEALEKRMEAFVDALMQAGGSILASRVISVQCRISRISWLRYTEKMTIEDVPDYVAEPF